MDDEFVVPGAQRFEFRFQFSASLSGRGHFQQRTNALLDPAGILDMRKLLRGLVKACEKRPVSISTLEVATDEIIAGLEACGEREIESRMIGARVMDKLHAIDPVAYVRYASVYRQFQDVGEFIDEIESMQHRVPRTVPHPELFEP